MLSPLEFVPLWIDILFLLFARTITVVIYRHQMHTTHITSPYQMVVYEHISLSVEYTMPLPVGAYGAVS